MWLGHMVSLVQSLYILIAFQVSMLFINNTRALKGQFFKNLNFTGASNKFPYLVFILYIFIPGLHIKLMLHYLNHFIQKQVQIN